MTFQEKNKLEELRKIWEKCHQLDDNHPEKKQAAVKLVKFANTLNEPYLPQKDWRAVSLARSYLKFNK